MNVALLKEADLAPVMKPATGIFLNNTVDFVGCNYYQPMRVQAPQAGKRPIKRSSRFVCPYDWPEKRINPHRGWEIYPRGFRYRDAPKESYDNSDLYISENGMGVSRLTLKTWMAIIEDDHRNRVLSKITGGIVG